MSIAIEDFGITENDIQVPISPPEQPIPSPIPTPTIVTWDGPSDSHDPLNWSPRNIWIDIGLTTSS
ncbi:hypothetical protein BHYA_0165g00160 [Botrytis hyacinthi]|uniref:Uncharacterized protein n=1 Tax=Botrytis hyacinthi TaxID=278943 RepID=A0A4Z1GE27_9HELO|nr:hypothetical protein BHYA_0165g00160 [Botrytis hyacinthi]